MFYMNRVFHVTKEMSCCPEISTSTLRPLALRQTIVGDEVHIVDADIVLGEGQRRHLGKLHDTAF